MLRFLRNVAALGCLVSTSPARAQYVGDYLNLSFTGDGESPSGLERLAQAAQRAPGPLAGSLAASPSGDATYAIPIALPPARLAPTVALSYNSGAGIGRVGRGWSIDVGAPTIREPIGQEAGAYDDDPGVWLVQGGGFSGLLVPALGTIDPVTFETVRMSYRWVSTTPGAVEGVLDYDAAGDTFTLRRNGVTWTLEPDTPHTFHAVSQVDGSGNRVDYTWFGRRIAEVRYGSTYAAGHFLAVEFGYTPTAHTLREGRGGFLDVITKRLRTIEVQSKYGHPSDTTRIRYDLWYDADDELLLDVMQTEVLADGTDGDVRELASFGYTTLVDGYEESTNVPVHLALSSGGGPEAGPSESLTWSTNTDVSGDGLPDELSTLSGGDWQVGWARLDRFYDPDFVERWWEDALNQAAPRILDQNGPLDQSTTVILYRDDVFPDLETRRGTYAVRRLVDVDGDGYQDVLETDQVPDEWDGTTDPTSSNNSPAPTTWTVRYGSAQGFGPERFELAPFLFPRISTRPDLAELPGDDWPTYQMFEDATVDLLDIDADGWLDVVQVGFGELTYWPKIRGRGEGWEANGIVALNGVPEMRSTQRSRGDVGQPGVLTVPIGGSYDVDVPSVSFLEAWTGFHDLNGDGVLDYVDTRDTGSWQVWLGKGGMFDGPITWQAPVGWISRSDEGSPGVTSCTVAIDELEPPIYAIVGAEDMDWRGGPNHPAGGGAGCSLPGIPSQQALVGGLIDMDGDGRQDLFDGEAGLWYRNMGDGFDGAHSIPVWWPEDTVYGGNTSKLLSTSWTRQLVYVADVPFPPDSSASQSDTVQTLLVADVDRDGLPDVVDFREDIDERVVRYSGRSVDVPTGYRPGLLERVETGAGAYMAIEWKSSATAIPSGDDDEVGSTPQRKDLVGALIVGDPTSGWEGRRDYDYQYGVVQRGKWLGFEVVEHAETMVSTDSRIPLNDGFDEEELGSVQEWYELGRDFALLERQLVSTDRNASWLPGRDPAEASMIARRDTAWTYGDIDLNLFVSTRWLVSIEVDESSETRLDMTAGETTRSFAVNVEYDEVGNVRSQEHVAEDQPTDTVELTVDWISSEDGALWRPRYASTWSANVDNPSDPLEVVEATFFSWDGGAPGQPPTAGLLTRQGACGGLLGANLCDEVEQLTWEFGRTNRGAVSEILAPAGRNTYNDSFAFGYKVVTTQRNALSYTTLRTVDDLGRVVEETDPNGVVRRTTLDAFGRTMSTESRGAGATLFRLETETTWHDDAIPNWSETTTYTWLADGSAGPSTISYIVYDGFGRELQSWSPADTGWVVVDRETDVRGSVRWTSEPHVEWGFSNDYDMTRGDTAASYSYVDIFGDPIRVVALDGSGGSIDHPLPGTVRYTLADGYERDERYDTHGRLVEVLQGRPASLTTTGRYVYDGRNRVRQFTDGNGNQWRYDFDGVGRVRQVWRWGTTTQQWAPYYAFSWDGPDPVQMYEGAAGSGATPVVEWFYDALGRATQKDVWDPVTGQWQTFTWAWDSQWKGAQDIVTDPSGYVSYAYAPHPKYGGFGFMTGTTRSWFDGTSATFGYAYDGDGRVTKTTWPSGAVVDASYYPNGWLQSHSIATSTNGLTVEYAYDHTWGLPSGWTMDVDLPVAKTFVHEVARIDSTKVSSLAWSDDPGIDDHTIHLNWYSNGWLLSKHIDALDAFSYSYDDLGRINAIWNAAVPGGATLEEYAYDAVGNPILFNRGGNAIEWTYDAPANFSEIRHRERPNGVNTITDDMTYEAVTGRLSSWDTTASNTVSRNYQYDGAGRLRRIDRASSAGWRATELSYDVDDNIVYETASTGAVTSIHRFAGWRLEQPTGRVIESVLPMVRLEDANKVRVAYLELDGHAMWTVGDAPLADTHEVLGAYGLPLYGFGSPATPWVMDHLHGAEADRDDEVVHFGARHMLLRDGLWMQPEPLLHLGITNGNLRSPLGYGGLYAAGNTNRFHDRSGWDPLLLLKMQASAQTGKPYNELSPAQILGANIAMVAESMSAPANAPAEGDTLEAPSGGEGLAMAAVFMGGKSFVDEATSALKSAGKAAASMLKGASKAAGGGGAPGFVVTPKGTAIPIPEGATGPTPAASGKGFQFTGGSGGHGLSEKITDVRIMDPTAPKGPSPGYPEGYASYTNKAGQTADPSTGKPVGKSDPAWHIPLDPPETP